MMQKFSMLHPLAVSEAYSTLAALSLCHKKKLPQNNFPYSKSINCLTSLSSVE